MGRKKLEVLGKKFGRLTVTGEAERLGMNRQVHVLCECGTKKEVRVAHLTNGITQSCGCLQKEIAREAKYTHGDTNTRLHTIWIAMRHRCSNPNTNGYPDYGGRGIKVCTEWETYENFKIWALANGYKENLSIDRKDVNGNYEPSNCHWADATYQMRNRRKTSKETSSKYIGISWFNEKQKWAAEIQVNGTRVRLGYFTDENEAALARNTYIQQNNLRGFPLNII